MKYVYLIRSDSHPRQSYVGITSDLKKRLIVHNSGGSVHTSNFKHWKLVNYVAISEDSKGLAFEPYLKIGSGRAFAKKRLWESRYLRLSFLTRKIRTHKKACTVRGEK